MIMTDQQIKNAITLCKGQPLSKILQLCKVAYRKPQIESMAKYFNCPADETQVAFHLMEGN